MFGLAASREKLDLLRAVAALRPRAGHLVRTLHETLCFLRAFDGDGVVAAEAGRQLADFAARVGRLTSRTRASLADSAIEGTVVTESFSWPAACWLHDRCGGQVEIDWRGGGTEADLDPLLRLLLTPGEQDGFEETPTARAWLRQARGDGPGGDFGWLVHALRHCGAAATTIEALYDAAELPLRWTLADGRHSRSGNALPRPDGMRRRTLRRPGGSAARAIVRPLPQVRRVSAGAGAALIDVAQAALLSRRREVYALNHANPRDVHVADLGCGTAVAVFGVRPGARLTLEANYGYVLLAGGAPVGYGGVSVLFHQANTGINVFPEYRHSEAAYLFTQTLRAFQTLFGCRRFIVNPYQFGQGNAEAIGSGAFWFYYRMGFRPADSEVADLAAAAARRMRAGRGRATAPDILRRLARCDLRLDVVRRRDTLLLDETVLQNCSLAATREIAAAGAGHRERGLRRIRQRVRAALGIDLAKWTADERRAFEHLSPVIAALPDLSDWPARDRHRLATLLRAKGAVTERAFIRAAQGHARLHAELRQQEGSARGQRIRT